MTHIHRPTARRHGLDALGDLDLATVDRADWRRGFDLAATGLDCRECGARVGVRPELAERHRQWHAELAGLLALAGRLAPGEDAPPGAAQSSIVAT